MPFRIQPFQPGLETHVLDLILPIQQVEFGVPITARDQPDLARIPEVYQTGRGGFWVGTLPQMGAAHRFYERNGFRRIGPGSLPPDFPRMAVDTVFYTLELPRAAAR